jgi:hypothetical protein
VDSQDRQAADIQRVDIRVDPAVDIQVGQAADTQRVDTQVGQAVDTQRVDSLVAVRLGTPVVDSPAVRLLGTPAADIQDTPARDSRPPAGIPGPAPGAEGSHSRMEDRPSFRRG